MDAHRLTRDLEAAYRGHVGEVAWHSLDPITTP